MDASASSPRVWLHGLTALILGLFLLGVSSGLGVMKNIVDFWGSVLFIPEYPVVMLRELYLGWLSRYNSSLSLSDEVIRLRSENAQLRLQLSRIRAADQNIFPSQDIIPPRTARVTLRAPMSWWSELRIDCGSDHSISQGLPVFSSGFLVGRVSTVSLFTSWVELITSSSFMIPAVVEDTRELGVVCGDGSGSVFLRYIPSGRGVKPGMKVSTAMIGEQLPPGLPIGSISGEAVVGADGYSTYRVEPGADMSALYTVSY